MNLISSSRRKDYESAVPVAISWDRDRILGFLKLQYEAGTPMSEKLLKLQLWLEIQEQVDSLLQSGESCTEQQLRDLVESANEYPASIRKMVLDDHDNGERRFESAETPRNVCAEEVDDMPF